MDMLTSHCRPKAPGQFRILHTSDWHLGKTLCEQPLDLEHGAFLKFLLRALKDLNVDALVVAGDVFDSANPPQSAVAAYFNFLSDLYLQGGCRGVIVAGNHDSPSHLEAPAGVLKALRTHVVGAHGEIPALIPLPDEQAPQVVIAAVPFLRDRDLRVGRPGQGIDEIRAELRLGIARRYGEVADATRAWRERGAAVLATGHLTVLGSTAAESEREIHVGGLGAVEADLFANLFSYTALGHLHRPQPAGRCEHVRYSGSPIPLSFGEAKDSKELRILDFADGKLVAQTPLPVPVTRRLHQVVCQWNEAESVLRTLAPPQGQATTWVEVVLQNAPGGNDLFRLVREWADGRPYEVIRVTARRESGAGGPDVPETARAGDIDDLLRDPGKIFNRRLEDAPGLTDETRNALKAVFRELCEAHAEKTREGQTTAARGVTA